MERGGPISRALAPSRARATLPSTITVPRGAQRHRPPSRGSRCGAHEVAPDVERLAFPREAPPEPPGAPRAVSGLGLGASALIGICIGFFGGGGSILTLPLLVYVFGLETKSAIASSLLVVGLASLCASVRHFVAGNVELRTAFVFGAGGVIGAYAGARIARLIDGTLLLMLFAALMIVAASAMWRGRRGVRDDATGDRADRRLVAQGAAVGLLTGVVGAGGGFLIVPALALWAGLPMRRAVGTSLLVIVLNTAAGFAGYTHHVAIDPQLVTAVAATTIAGALVGAQLTRLVDPTLLRRGFAGLIVTIAVLVLAQESRAWVPSVERALPATAAQIAFTLAALGLGIFAGRASRPARADPLDERLFDQGGGI